MNFNTDNETKVIGLLSGYVRELKEGKDYQETTFKLAKEIDNMYTEKVSESRSLNSIKYERVKIIIDNFNEKYDIGDTVLWKPVSTHGYTPVEMTVKSPAYSNFGKPVVFFNERSGFCSIEPEHLKR